MMSESRTKSKKRVADYGEVFTAEREVNAMLDLVKQETERIDSRFLEPACGNGNFLAEILRRKLAIVKLRYSKNVADYELYVVIAVTSIYGVDILQDNVDECINRMYEIFDNEYTENCKQEVNDETREAVLYILRHNILCGDALTMKMSASKPIMFAEWSAVNGGLIKRRDFRFDQMLEGYQDSLQLDLFSGQNGWEYDEEAKAFIPSPIREYPLVHYRRLRQYE